MTIEELRSYKQIRTPDYAALANYVNRAKGDKRTMAQFAEDTGIGASTLSRIANMKIQKPLAIEVLFTIYENRADPQDDRLGILLARANGLVSPERIGAMNERHSRYGRQYEEENRELMMKNGIIAGVAAAGIPIIKVENSTMLTRRQLDVPLTYHGPVYNFRMLIGPTVSGIDTWDFYTYSGLVFGQDDPYPRNPEFMCRDAFRRIQHHLLRDAWEPESLRNRKISIAFLDEEVFNLFVEAIRPAKVHNEFSALLLNRHTFSVIDEVWFPGQYTGLSNVSIFQMPAPIDSDDDTDYEDYEPENMEDNE